MSLGAADQQVLDDDLARLNDQHPDSLLFVARHLVPAPEASVARIEDIALDGVTLRLRDGMVWRSVLLPLQASNVDELRTALYGLVTRARSVAGSGEAPTSIEDEIAEATGLPTRMTTVVDAAPVGGRFRQLTVAVDNFAPIGADQFFLVTPDIEEAPSAYYTVRRFRDDEIDLWFLRHDHPGTVAAWAMTATVGARVSLWGPRRSYRPPSGIHHLLLVADETGIPAVAAILEQRESEQRATVLLEVDDPDDQVDLDLRVGDMVRWLRRTDDGLLDEVARVAIDPQSTYAWGGAESRQITRIRSYLRHQVGMERNHVQMTGYWRRQNTG